MVLLITTLILTVSSGCAYIQKAAFASADAAEAYCESNTATGRELVRQQIAPAMAEKDMAFGLRCPGDDKMFISGDPKTVVVD
jgi:hypothetical protein